MTDNGCFFAAVKMHNISKLLLTGYWLISPLLSPFKDNFNFEGQIVHTGWLLGYCDFFSYCLNSDIVRTLTTNVGVVKITNFNTFYLSFNS